MASPGDIAAKTGGVTKDEPRQLPLDAELCQLHHRTVPVENTLREHHAFALSTCALADSHGIPQRLLGTPSPMKVAAKLDALFRGEECIELLRLLVNQVHMQSGAVREPIPQQGKDC